MPEQEILKEAGRPLPRYLPPSTFWPLGLAMGTTLFVWAPALEYAVPWVIAPTGRF